MKKRRIAGIVLLSCMYLSMFVAIGVHQDIITALIAFGVFTGAIVLFLIAWALMLG